MKKKLERQSVGRHPLNQIESALQILMAGTRDYRVRLTFHYHDAWVKVRWAVQAITTKILGSRGILSAAWKADDIVQEWSLKMERRGFAVCDPRLPCYPFAYRVLLRTISNHLRGERPWQFFVNEQWIADPVVSTEAERLANIQARVGPILSQLPLPLRQAAYSQYWECLSAAEAAEKYGTTVPQMYRLRFLARRVIERLLGEDDSSDAA